VVAGVVFVATAFIVINGALDVLYTAIDPRIRLRRWQSSG
jgi:ABC-type dipeptide/oligopeptide/nickel transport system permease component